MFFFRSVALLCSLKKPSSGHKILVFRLNETTQDEFNDSDQEVIFEVCVIISSFTTVGFKEG